MQGEVKSLTGRVLGEYRLLHELGAGGMGVVYVAQRLDNPSALVAVKLLMPAAPMPPAAFAAFRKRFLREAQAAYNLRHAHILPVYALGEDGDLSYMVLPLIRGGTLAAGIHDWPHGMPFEEIALYLQQIADALDFAHQHGVVHRDIKPTNMLLEHDQAYLADFGLVRVFDAQAHPLGDTLSTLTVTGHVLGTPLYMAPEQMNTHAVGPAADIYALGVVLYQMVTGQVPFQAETPLALAMKHVQDQPLAPSTLRHDLPPTAEAAILRALAKRPGDRFESAGSLARAFIAGLQARPATATHSPAVAAFPPTVGVPFTSQQAAQAHRAGWSRTVQATGTSTDQVIGATGPGPTWAQIKRLYRGKGGGPSNPAIRLSALAALVLAVVVGAVVLNLLTGVVLASRPSSLGPTSAGKGTSVQPTSTPASHAAPMAGALVPAGQVLYQATAPGACDAGGASWAQNARANQSCSRGDLVLSDDDCNCAIGVVTLAALPAAAYPIDYVAEVTAEPVGTAPWAKFGFKFRQQSISDTSNRRGGYAFLIDPRGWYQFNRYDANGTRHILVEQHLSQGVSGPATLDLVVSGTNYAFYLNGKLVLTRSDSTYRTGGYFCLAVEPAANVHFRNLALFTQA